MGNPGYHRRQATDPLLFKTSKEVQDKKAALEAEVIKGTYAEPSAVTFGQWLARWLDVYVKPAVRDTVHADYESIIKLHILPALGDMPIQKLRPSDLQAFYKAKLEGGRLDGKEGGLSTRTVRLLHFLIGKALKQAFKEVLAARNVNEATILPKMVKKEPRYLAPQELETFIGVMAQSRHFAPL
ncbi:MAG: N-terminal phage integrase SAM-like domain-containing protein [Peptococcaceae bacterium]|nr:N-terminal phage integrase SAM-like domain-containing protein [Peptococcaceae bacterium]